MIASESHLARRNSVLMTLEGTLFWAGLSFLEGNTVISVFMNETTGSAAMAGMAATLRTLLFLVGQFVVGMFIHRVRVQSRFMAIVGCLSRPLILLAIPALLGGASGPAAAYLFLALYGLTFFCDGFVGLCWNEICVRTLPLKRRGEVISLQQTFSGLVGLMGGAALRAILGSSLSMQHQFSIIFGLSGLCMVLDAIVLCLIRDVPHPSAPERPVPSLSAYLGQFVPLFSQSPTVRRVLLGRALYLLTLISAPINILFGIQAGLSTAQQATLVFMPVVGQIAAGLLWARVSRRWGYPMMMLMAQVLGVLSALINFACLGFSAMGWPVMAPLSLVMVLISINTPAYTGYFQHMVACVDADNRALYIVLASTMMAPLSLGTYFAGIICERWGYAPVYLIMLAAGLCGLWVVWSGFFSERSPLPAEHRHQG